MGYSSIADLSVGPLFDNERARGPRGGLQVVQVVHTAQQGALAGLGRLDRVSY